MLALLLIEPAPTLLSVPRLIGIWALIGAAMLLVMARRPQRDNTERSAVTS